MKKLFAEFKAFISKGNVLDLAVGMIIGAAFTAIVNALVNGILKPLIAMIPGADGTSALQVVLKEAQYATPGDPTSELLQDAVILDFGEVISAVITFLLTALILFIIVKAISTAQKKAAKIKEDAKKAHEDKLRAEGKLPPLEEESEDEEIAPPTTEELLTQIRDLLMMQNKVTTAAIEPETPAAIAENESISD